jgi:hypothetical protein
LPAARLQPLPFLEPTRLLDLVEQDPSLIEAGLRIVARRVSLPVKSGGTVLDALASDSRNRCVLLRSAESLTPRIIEEILAARGWISESLPTLRSLRPDLPAGGEIRCVLLTSRVDEAAGALLSLLAGAAPEVLMVHAFDSPSGLALSVVAAATAVAIPAAARPRPSPTPSPAAERRPSPLAGIPLTADEMAEFRRVSSARSHVARSPSAAEPRPATDFHPASDFRGRFLEN